MSMKFTVSVHKGDKYYIARVPELGVTTQGRTREEAKKNLREAIQVHLEAIAEYAMKYGRVEIEKAQLVS
ncbi:MAG: type II toxin-antitoxin system HicB family antitoxin [Nitrososphaerales archaeon]